MDKEQRRRMAERTIISEDESQCEITYTVQVSGERVEIIRGWEVSQDEGDPQVDCWIMSTSDLKRLIEAAQWCIEKSEAFEATHPPKEESK